MVNHMLAKQNRILLPLTAGLNAFNSLLLGIGGLLIIRQLSHSFLLYGVVSAISSIAIIGSTIFIGAKIDTLDKRKVFITVNCIAIILLLLLVQFWGSSRFLIYFMGFDLLMGFLSLFAGIAFSGSIKEFTVPEQLDQVVSRISTSRMVGILASMGTVFLYATSSHLIPYLLETVAIATFISIISSLFIKRATTTVIQNTTSLTLRNIKHASLQIWHDELIKSMIMINIFILTIQSAFNGFIIFFWSTIDPNYSKLSSLLIAYAVGIGIGYLALRINQNGLRMLLMLVTISCALLYAFVQSESTLIAVIISIMAVSLPVENWTQRNIIKYSDVRVQGLREGYVSFFSAILDTLFSTVIAGVLQVLHHENDFFLLLIVLGTIIFVYYNNKIKQLKKAI